MPLPALLSSLLGAIGTGAKALPKIGNSIGKGLVTGSKYIGQVSNNLSPLAQMLSGYGGGGGQIPPYSSAQPMAIMSQNSGIVRARRVEDPVPMRSETTLSRSGLFQDNQSPYGGVSNPNDSSAMARRMRGYFGG